MLIDTHCHLDDPRFYSDREQVIRNMLDSGVDMCVTIGADAETSRGAVEIAERYPFIYAACGFHPHEAKSMTDEDLAWLKGIMAHPRVRAWGEIGLDYHYDHSERSVQRDCFERQLDCAAELGKPVVLHIREAHGDAYDMLAARKNLPKCVLHCFSGSREMMDRYMALGLYVSFGGAVTYKNAENLRYAARFAPDDRIMVETDCPYLAPAPMRGKRNECAFVAHTARFLADLRDEAFEVFALKTTENAKSFFGI